SRKSMVGKSIRLALELGNDRVEKFYEAARAHPVPCCREMHGIASHERRAGPVPCVCAAFPRRDIRPVPKWNACFLRQISLNLAHAAEFGRHGPDAFGAVCKVRFVSFAAN